jgi:stress response protein YsnF
VKKKAVPVERVGLDKDVTTEHEQVSDEVRKEQVDIDDDSRRSS